MSKQQVTDPRAGFRVERDGNEVRLAGVIDEHASLDFLRGAQGKVTVNLREVRRINSVGVRQWMEAVRAIPNSATVELSEARPPIVDQINMVAGFLGRAHLVSFYAPMVCPKCDNQTEVLLDVDAARDGLPEKLCPSCSTAMELDDVEEEYLSFLREA